MKSTSRPALTCYPASTLSYSLQRVRDRIHFEAGVDLRFRGRPLVSAVPVRNGINFLERRQVRSRGCAACCSATEKNWHKEIRLAGNYPPIAKLLLLSALAKIQFDLCCTHTESHVKKHQVLLRLHQPRLGKSSTTCYQKEFNAPAKRTHQKLPRILRVLCSMHLEDVRNYDYVNYVVPALHQLHRALQLLATRLHGLYVNLVVRREYSSPGRSGSTSTTPYAAVTSSSGRTTTSTTYLD
jgi:hypothetical protein